MTMEYILDVRGLKVVLKKEIYGAGIEILRGVEFTIRKKESLALVGESGSGKTLTAMSIMGLLPENISLIEGEILLCGTDIVKISQQELRYLRGVKAGMIFQEPSSYLNPVFTAGSQILEAIKARDISKEEKKDICVKMLKDVGLKEDI